MLLSYLLGVILHRPLRVPPRIRASRVRMDLLMGRVSCSTVHVFTESRKLPVADEIFYLILQIEARCGSVPTRVVVQAVLVLVLL